jgi:hypothetical protein
MWYDDPFVKFKSRKRRNRRVRRPSREPILMVNARMLDRRRERMQRAGTLFLCVGALLATGWLTVQGGWFFGRLLFSRNPLYTVQHYDVYSDGRRIPAALILEFAELTEGVNLFAVDLRDVRMKLEDVSLFHRALVERIVPDTMSGPLEKRLRPGKHVDDRAILDAITVINLCDSDLELARVLELRRVDVSDDGVLLLILPGDESGNLPWVQATVGRGEKLEHNVRKLAATLHYANATGRLFQEYNFSVQKNQAVQ